MLKDRILSTINFFDLQDYPLTLLELHTFLIADLKTLKPKLDLKWEITGELSDTQTQQVPIDRLFKMLEVDLRLEAENVKGFYCLKGRQNIVSQRLENYLYGIKRERLIRRYAKALRHIPFVRGVALGGSQAMGRQNPNSDIDLLIITVENFMWLARIFVTAYFQVLGIRRHGRFIADRFCLNHYFTHPKKITQLKNLYSAMEYAKLRPLAYSRAIAAFESNNADWIKQCFPNWQPCIGFPEEQSKTQVILEKIFSNRFFSWLQGKLKNWQLARIKKDEFIIVEEDELSFHPNSKQQELLQLFFKDN